MSHLPADIHKRLDPKRQPMRRRGDDMDLPPGNTCFDCRYYRRCNLMFGHIDTDEVCDWSPSRFSQKETAP